MARKKQLIIPVFIPFAGCSHRCVFCDQNGIAGTSSVPEPAVVPDTIRRYLATWTREGRREVAFYGGSFTGLPAHMQEGYLAAVRPFLEDGRIDGVRVSTRPDYITGKSVQLLKRYGVDTVELGVQSMDDNVLVLSGRGHKAAETVRAVEMLKREGLKVGVQIMPGLPGDTRKSILDTAGTVIRLMPDFVRIYPALVLKNTALHRMYERGEYAPWTLEDMVEVCRVIADQFASSGVNVIRMGLQPTAELESMLVGGPYHPSFRQLVEETQGC